MNDVVVYDGDCGICEWSAGWIRKHATRFIGRVIGAPVLRFLARGIYFVIAKNRRLISRMFGLKACALPPR